jgi:NAD-dependent dihydropyrimidine dehydrogenase PreA subunit
MARTRTPDTTLRFDEDKCTGCRTCTEVCPHAVFRMNGKVAHLERLEDCMECGACALNCREGAISVDSGVGCASAQIMTALHLRKEPRCC